MPSEKRQLVRLQMNAIGVIDFEQNSFSLDAILYDSRLGAFPLTGGMAMRLNWGAAPAFALSIGGFHPAFKAPANFPTLDRLAISFSNTERFSPAGRVLRRDHVQHGAFGAKLELFAKAGKFSMDGRVGLTCYSIQSVRVRRRPLRFGADQGGSAQPAQSQSHGRAVGPRRCTSRARRRSKSSVAISRSARQDARRGRAPPQLEPVNVAEQLSVALNDARNWSGQLAEAERRLVTLREAAAPDQISLHPLGRLSVKQNVVPLELEIARFGNTTPQGARLFKITGLSVNGKGVAFDREKDFFAPAQFLALSDDETLAAPSFERMTAGLSVGAESFLFATNDADTSIRSDHLRERSSLIRARRRTANRVRSRRWLPSARSFSTDILPWEPRPAVNCGGRARRGTRPPPARRAGEKGLDQSPRPRTVRPRTRPASHPARSFLTPNPSGFADFKRENPIKAKTLMLLAYERRRSGRLG